MIEFNTGLYALVIITSLLTGCDGTESNQGSAETTDSTEKVNHIQLPSGLVIEILERGDGPMPEKGDIVSVEYVGKLKSTGTVFDSSSTGQPFKFPIGSGRVIKGWDEGIAQIPVGSHAILDVPAQLAYGSRDRGPIPANSDLIFEVHLTDITPAPKPIAHEVFETEGLELHETSSGLQYYIIEEGTGPKAESGKQALVHYYGYFRETGEKFDSSFDRGEPLPLQVGANQVIPGWEEGIALLKAGAKAKLIVPSHLAYGEAGFRGVIPPNADLVFDVQIMAVR